MPVTQRVPSALPEHPVIIEVARVRYVGHYAGLPVYVDPAMPSDVVLRLAFAIGAEWPT